MKHLKTIFNLLLFFFISMNFSTSYVYAADWSCSPNNGQNVQNINNAVTDASKNYTTNTTDHDSRYFKFKTLVSGSITISFDNTNSEQQAMRIGTTCGDNDLFGSGNQNSASYTFNVTANTLYYIQMQERNNNDSLRFRLSFDFTADDISADLKVLENGAPSPDPANIGQDVTFKVRSQNRGPDVGVKNIVVKVSYDQDVSISSVTSSANDFICDTTSGNLSAGAFITCIKSSHWTSITNNKDFTFVVQPSVAPTLTQTVTIASDVSPDPDTSNNTLTSSVTVNGGNNPPIFTSTPITTGTVGVDYGYIVQVNDPENDDFTVVATVKPSWLTWDANSLTLSGNPTTAGTYDVTLTATDEYNAAATQVFQVVVSAASTNTPPIADAGSDQTVIAGTSVTLDGSGSSDTDGIIASYSWSDGSNTWGGVNPSISTAGWSNGPHTIVLTVTDNNGATDTDNVTINIGDNEPPTNIALDNNTITEYNIVGKIIGDFSTTDPDTGDTHTYTLVTGAGDSGNASFTISENALKANKVFDQDEQASYTIRVRTTDSDGGFFEKVFTITVTDVSYDFDNSNVRPFTKVSLDGSESTNIAGDLLVIGNQSLCKHNSDGECEDPGSAATNNSVFQNNINLDTASTYVNSTSADLTLNDNDIIVDAWLYWIGRLSGETDKRANASRIYFKTPTSNTYIELHSQSDKFAWSRDGNTLDYGGAVNVKQHVLEGRGGTYWVADLQATEMQNQGSGWALAVVVEDPDAETRTVKNISLYDGFTGVYSGANDLPDEITQNIAGFKTPKTGEVKSKLVLFSGESDRALDDRMSLTDKGDAEHYITDSLDDDHNIQNATISRDGSNVTDRNPNFENTLGVDIDVINVSDIIDNNQTETDITLYSESDRIFLALYGFTTELYIPKLCYDYTLDIGGHVIPSVDNEIDTPFGGFGLPLTTVAYIRSTEGDLSLTNVSIQYHINDTTELAYNTSLCSTKISEVGQFDYTDACPYTYNEITSGFEMYIGADKTPLSGGVFAPNEDRYIKWESDFQQSDVNTSFTFTANFSVDYGAGNVDLSQIFTAEDLCPTLNDGGFLPALGLFNIVDSRNDHTYYNLYTQVSKRPFDLTVYAYDAADFETLYSSPLDLNLTVEVEMIRADHFSRDADVACNDPHSILSEVPPKFPHFNGTAGASFSYNAEDLNLAYRSSAMRVWYLTKDIDNVTTVINDHHCTSLQEDKSECEELYLRDYSSTDTICETKCAIGSNWNPIDNCYSCLRTTYGRKVCSRDNFAIRPESFITKILDSNESENIDDPSNVLPTEAADPIVPAHAIAGYKYRFDINATNHVDNAATPRYLQHFEPGSDIHRVRMQWYPTEVTPSTNACNDGEDKNITINLFNGSDVNYHARTSYVDKVQQVGEYRFEIFDENWTSADWNRDEMPHHFGEYSGHYLTDPDCLRGNSIVRELSNQTDRNGCKTSSIHTNPDTGETYDYHYTRYYPYSFSVNDLNNSIGISDSNPLYINTPNADDENMTYNIQGTFGAIGKDGYLTSNFVDGCYAEDVNMDLYQYYLHDDAGLKTPYLSYDLIDFNTTNPSLIYRSREQGNFTVTNTTATTTLNPLRIVQGAQYFNKEMNGTITMDLGYNFIRTYNTPLNPRQIRMVDFNVTFVTNPLNLYVDLETDHLISGEKNLNQDITFLYGRAKTDLFFYEDVAASTINTPVSIVNYCNLGYTTCQNRGILAFLGQTNESDWWLSVDHNSAEGDGDITLEIGAISEGSGSPAVSPDSPVPLSILANAIDDTVIVSAGNNPSLPMTVEIDFNMDDTLSSFTNTWLIYNNSADSIPSPFFKVRFIGPSGWAGHGDTGHVVNSESNVKKNQRLGW